MEVSEGTCSHGVSAAQAEGDVENWTSGLESVVSGHLANNNLVQFRLRDENIPNNYPVVMTGLFIKDIIKPGNIIEMTNGELRIMEYDYIQYAKKWSFVHTPVFLLPVTIRALKASFSSFLRANDLEPEDRVINTLLLYLVTTSNVISVKKNVVVWSLKTA